LFDVEFMQVICPTGQELFSIPPQIYSPGLFIQIPERVALFFVWAAFPEISRPVASLPEQPFAAGLRAPC